MTAAPPTRTHLLSIYRRIIRELPIRQPSASPNPAASSPTAHQRLSAPTHLQKRIRAAIGAPPAQGANPTSQIQEAEQFIRYIQAQRQYVTLVERYNGGWDMTEEERVRLTARRVGMELPVDYEGEEK